MFFGGERSCLLGLVEILVGVIGVNGVVLFGFCFLWMEGGVVDRVFEKLVLVVCGLLVMVLGVLNS